MSESSLKGDQRTEKYLMSNTMDLVQGLDKGSVCSCALLNDQESNTFFKLCRSDFKN